MNNFQNSTSKCAIRTVQRLVGTNSHDVGQMMLQVTFPLNGAVRKVTIKN